MQASISRYFAKSKTTPSSSSSSTASGGDGGCVGSDGISSSRCLDESVPLIFDMNPNLTRATKFSSVLNTMFDRCDASSSTSAPVQQQQAKASAQQLTPLERQVVELKAQYKGCLLMVECGYRFRFFGEDADLASKALNIWSRFDHSFLVASIPTYRVVFHLKRLVAAGYKVALVRQTETAAIRKSTKGSVPQKATFSRAVVGVFSSSTMLDDDDPAFSDLLKSSSSGGGSSSRTDGEGIHEDGDEDLSGDEGDMELQQDAVMEQDQQQREMEEMDADAWLLCVCDSVEDGDTTLVALVALDVRSHSLKHQVVELDSVGQKLRDTLHCIEPKEVLIADRTSKEVSRVIEEVFAKSSAQSSLSNKANRICFAKQESFLAKDTDEWIQELHPLEQQASIGLRNYLASFKLENALVGPEVSSLSEVFPATTNSSDGGKGHDDLDSKCFFLDAVSCRDLEIFQIQDLAPSRGNPHLILGKGVLKADGKAKECRQEGSLFWLLNKCKSPFGRRTLKEWILRPLTQTEGIQRRQGVVVWLHSAWSDDRAPWVKTCQGVLCALSEADKLLAALHHQRISPRRLHQLFRCVLRLSELRTGSAASLAGLSNPSSSAVPAYLSECLLRASPDGLLKAASKLLACMNSTAAGEDDLVNIFTATYEANYPELAALRADLAHALQEMDDELNLIRKVLNNQSQEFKTLKQGSSAIEYLIEVPNTHGRSIPSSWLVVNNTQKAVRYHTPQVLDIQSRILRIKEELQLAAKRVFALFLVQANEEIHGPLRTALYALGCLDVLISFAHHLSQPGYTMPEYSNHSETYLLGARHPTAELFLEEAGAAFVDNDVVLRFDHNNRCCQVITGPNMGGKSLYVRMIALCCLMGQIGCPVPASHARLSPYDNIFTRMGAGDDLASGMSTFMVELFRTSRILQKVTSRSLVILDELGRGTSTHDGVAIAKSTLQYIVETIGCSLLFVTHFRPISEMVTAERSLQAKCVNVHMAYIEDENDEEENENEGEGGGEEEVDGCIHKRPRLECSQDQRYLDVLGTGTGVRRQKRRNNITFLYKISEGPADASFGLNVARLVGFDTNFLDLAAQKAAWMQQIYEI